MSATTANATATAAAATAATATADLTTMTRMELYKAFLRQTTMTNKAHERVTILSRRLEKAREKVARYHERSENSRGALYRRSLDQMETWEYHVLAHEHELRIATEKHAHEVRYLEEIQARRAEARLAPTPRRVRTVVCEQKQDVSHVKEQESKEEPIRLDPLTFLVRLLSGELQTVEVDGVQPVSEFAKEFARQNGYHPSAAKRMTFFYPAAEAAGDAGGDAGEEEEEKEKEPIPFWTPEKYPVGTTFREHFPHGQEETPLLCLFLRPADPSTRTEKVELLRRILTEEGRYNMYSDADLFTTYDGWYLTHRPRPRENRYQTMKTFVAAYSEKFWFMNPQEKEQSDAWNAEWKEVLAFKNSMVQEVQCISCRHRISPQFAEQRTVVRQGILSVLGKGEWGLQRLQGTGDTLRRFMSLHELHQLGLPFTLLCSCQKTSCHVCHFPSWMERAGADFIVPEVSEKDHSIDPATLLAVMIGGNAH